jgi:Zinc carboxypeptidase
VGGARSDRASLAGRASAAPRAAAARAGAAQRAAAALAALIALAALVLAAPARAACPPAPSPPPIDRPASAARVDAYVRAVARASPVVTTAVAGRSVEGRPLRYAVVTALSAGRLRAGLARLRAVRAGRARAVGDAPALVWIAGSVHGNEPSGADADLRLLRELARRCDDPMLRRVVVVVMPVQNPDGHEARTRYNANGFDLNRDWLADTQPETDARLRTLLTMPPLVYADQHEQGGGAFFFPPYAAPRFHELPAAPLAAERDVLAPALRAAFDRHGYESTSEGFDLLYPGYGDSATTLLLGAAGMTLEAGAAQRYARRVHEHLLAARTIIAAVARHRRALLRGWARSFAQAEEQGARGVLQRRPESRVYGYALGAGAEPLVRLLRAEGVRIRRLAAPAPVAAYRPYGAAAAAAATLPAGTYLVPSAQPLKHWVQAVLGQSPLAGAAPVSDVGAWSRPLLMGVAGGTVASTLPAAPAAPTPSAAAARPLAGRRVALLADPQARASVPPGIAQPNPGTSWARWVLAERLDAQVAVVDGPQTAAGALAGHDALIVADGSPPALTPPALQAIAAYVTAGGNYVGWRTRGIQVAAAAGLTTATIDPTPPALRIPGAAVRVGENVVLDVDDPPIVGGNVIATYGAILSGWASASPAGRPAILDERPGAGRAILFAFDPTYRAATESAEALLTSALLATPGARRSAASRRSPRRPAPAAVPAAAR